MSLRIIVKDSPDADPICPDCSCHQIIQAENQSEQHFCSSYAITGGEASMELNSFAVKCSAFESKWTTLDSEQQQQPFWTGAWVLSAAHPDDNEEEEPKTGFAPTNGEEKEEEEEEERIPRFLSPKERFQMFGSYNPFDYRL